MRSGSVSPSSRRVLVGVAYPPASSIESISCTRLKSSLGVLISTSSVMTTSWIFSNSSMIVNISRVLSWFSGVFSAQIKVSQIVVVCIRTGRQRNVTVSVGGGFLDIQNLLVG